LGLLHALKGVGNRPFYRWLTRDYRPLFPRLPERTRLFRLLKTHQDWTRAFLAAPTVLGVIDTYGIELIHPMRQGRSPQPIGRTALSNHRWIVGGKLCLLLNQWGLVVGWACATANVADNTFQWLVVFQKWRWPFLHRPSKGIAVDKQANHDVMHLRGFREADRLADQAFDACPQCQVLTLDLLGVPFARTMHVGIQMPGVGPPVG